jgi:hypothetical protein
MAKKLKNSTASSTKKNSTELPVPPELLDFQEDTPEEMNDDELYDPEQMDESEDDNDRAFPAPEMNGVDEGEGSRSWAGRK